MKTIFFILKHFFNFLCIDALIFKANKAKITLFILSLFISCIALFFLDDQSIKHIITSINDIICWFFLVSLFKTLKKQNFFYNLIINRCFYHILPELLLFLTSIYAFFLPINILFILSEKNVLFNFISTPISLIADAFLFIICSIWKYVFIQSIIIITFLVHSIMLKSNLDIVEILSAKNTLFYITIIVSFIKISISANEINKNPKCCGNHLN